jgi:hypothetical protein
MGHKVMVHLLRNNSNIILEVLNLFIHLRINKVIRNMIKAIFIHHSKVMVVDHHNKVMAVDHHSKAMAVDHHLICNNQILISKSQYESVAMNELI